MSGSGRLWEAAVKGWKGAFGLGTFGWALYGTVAHHAFGRSPNWDAELAFGISALVGCLWGVASARGSLQGGGSCQTLT